MHKILVAVTVLGTVLMVVGEMIFLSGDMEIIALTLTPIAGLVLALLVLVFGRTVDLAKYKKIMADVYRIFWWIRELLRETRFITAPWSWLTVVLACFVSLERLCRSHPQYTPLWIVMCGGITFMIVLVSQIMDLLHARAARRG
jgi:hypothetical protein